MLIILATQEATSPPYEQEHACTQTHRQWQKHARRVGKRADGGQPGLHLTDRKIKQKMEWTGGTYGVSSGMDPAAVNHTLNHLPGRHVETMGRWALAQRRNTCKHRKKRTNPTSSPFYPTSPSHAPLYPAYNTAKHTFLHTPKPLPVGPAPQPTNTAGHRKREYKTEIHAASLHLVTPAAGLCRFTWSAPRLGQHARARHSSAPIGLQESATPQPDERRGLSVPLSLQMNPTHALAQQS